METSKDVQKNLKRAYEMSRIRWASKIAFVVVPLVVFSIYLCGSPTLQCVAGLFLLIISWFALWTGKEAGEAVRIAFYLGIFAYALPWVMCYAEYFAGVPNLANGGCLIGGFVAGFILWKQSRSLIRGRKKYLVTGGAIISLIGFMGCVHFGSSFAVIIVSGVILPLLPSFFGASNKG